MFTRFARFGLAISLWLLVAVGAQAQLGAAIQGTVKDSSGAALSGAKVTVTDEDTGRMATANTSPAGFFSVRGLTPGLYSVSVEAATFKTASVTHVAVEAETPKGLDLTLQPAAATTTVEVNESVRGVETETANITDALSSQELNRLPQFGRDPYNALRLAPGIFADMARSSSGGAFSLPNSNYGPQGSSQSIYQVENQVQISANGQRISANSYEVDGVNVNSLTWGGAAVLTPNIESVNEIKVISGSYSAEDGRNSGADVKVVSKTGTNSFHGSAFLRYDEPGLNAFNTYGGFNNAKAARVNQKLRDFGGSVGGPIVHNKLFFFFSYEGLRQNDLQVSNQYIETSQYRSLIATARPNSQIAKVLAAPGVQPRVIALLPTNCSAFNASTCRVVSGGIDLGSPQFATGQYVSLGNPVGGGFDGIPDLVFAQLGVPSHTRGNQYNGRVDYTRGNDTFAVSSYVTDQNSIGGDAAAQGRPMADVPFQPRIPVITALWNHTFGGTLLNEARVNFNRFAFNQVNGGGNVNYGIPRIEVEGLNIGGRIRFGADRSETTPGVFAQNTYEFRDVVSKVFRNQSAKFGFEIRREQDNSSLVGGARPDYSNVGLWNLANETPIFEAINIDPRTATASTAQHYFRTSDYAAFAQDDWKVHSGLTLNLGLRWEYFSPFRDKAGLNTNLILPPGSTLVGAVIKIGGQQYKPDRNNFAPRFGFAWQPGASSAFGNGLLGSVVSRAVVRGGFGVSFNRIPDVLFSNSRGNPPFFAREGLCCGTAVGDFGSPFAGNTILFGLSNNSIFGYPVAPALKQGVDPVTNLPVAGAVEVWGAFQNTPTPYVYNFSLGTEWALPMNFALNVGYEGSDGKKLIRIINTNFILDQKNPHISQAFFPDPHITSNYNSLNVRVLHHFSHGVEFLAKYRWSKSMDELSNEGPCACANQTFPRDLRTEYGPSDYDAKHFLVTSALWDLPIFRGRHDALGAVLGGWQINGIWTYHTGFPWTPVTNAQALKFPGGDVLSPIRPIAYFGNAGHSESNTAFITGSNFPGGGKNFFNISAPGVPGIGRNSWRGPRYQAMDFSFVKNFKLSDLHMGEQANLEFRANAFNVFNHQNLQSFGFNTSSTIINDPNFGKSAGALAGRVVEFQARFAF